MLIVSLTINYSTAKSVSIVNEAATPEFFKPIFSGNGTDHMNINIVNLADQNLSVGDEIGIFDGENCVGAVRVTEANLNFNYVQIAASSNDEISNRTNGFVEGNELQAYVYKNGELYAATISSKLNSNKVFIKNESLFATLAFDMTNSIEIDDVLSSEILCYPNPFSDALTISYFSAGVENVEVCIYNLNGQKVRTLFDGRINGSSSFVWDGLNEAGQRVPFGIYTVKANENITKIIFK